MVGEWHFEQIEMFRYIYNILMGMTIGVDESVKVFTLVTVLVGTRLCLLGFVDNVH